MTHDHEHIQLVFARKFLITKDLLVRNLTSRSPKVLGVGTQETGRLIGVIAVI